MVNVINARNDILWNNNQSGYSIYQIGTEMNAMFSNIG